MLTDCEVLLTLHTLIKIFIVAEQQKELVVSC